MRPDSCIRLEACGVGDNRNVALLADAFQRRVWANPGEVGDWGSAQMAWIYRDPVKRK
jgi:hypothetical protein